jgi:hypothetical protein
MTSMSTRAGEVRSLTLLDISLDPYDRRNGAPKPGKLDQYTYSFVPSHLLNEVRLIALDGLEDRPHVCRDCGNPVGYHRVENDEGAFQWISLFLLASSGHIAALCDECGVLPEVIQ